MGGFGGLLVRSKGACAGLVAGCWGGGSQDVQSVVLVWAPFHVVLLQVTDLPVHRIRISSLSRRQACVLISFVPYVGRAQNSNRETYP